MANLLLEIGVEELPASYVASALRALPKLLRDELKELRISHGDVWVGGTPRRLAITISDVLQRQPDLDEEVVGPPARVAFDSDGKPTRAAESFAKKVGCDVAELTRVDTPKGEYLAGRRQQAGEPTTALLSDVFPRVCSKLSFRKSMRWSDGDTAFGRPVRWLVGLLGEEQIEFEFAGVRSASVSTGHRFLAPGPLEIKSADGYREALRQADVLVDTQERREAMQHALKAGAAEAGGILIEDDFLIGENLSLVEKPHVVVGGFDEEFLELPDRVVLEVAKGHQRYFGVRSADGGLLPRYLAVVNTAVNPPNVRRGNDRVMRARLADAKFFYDEDLKRDLASRRSELDAVVFQKRLGSIGDKVRRIEKLIPKLGAIAGLESDEISDAVSGASLAKCDLVTLMVGEFPELQGEMGRAYALKQGVAPSVADIVFQHYQPRGADDETPARPAAALVSVADRLDTLVGCFAIGIVPTGTADPLALRRAAIGLLRTVLATGWDFGLVRATTAAYEGFDSAQLDAPSADVTEKLGMFFRDRLRGILTDELPNDAVDACLASAPAGDAPTGFDSPVDVAERAKALGAMAPDVRASAGEVFKRAANIAKDAPDGAVEDPSRLQDAPEQAELDLWGAFQRLKHDLKGSRGERSYPVALTAIATFAPVLGKYFDDVFVMVDDEKLRANRLRLMRDIHATCSSLANFRLLAAK